MFSLRTPQREYTLFLPFLSFCFLSFIYHLTFPFLFVFLNIFWPFMALLTRLHLCLCLCVVVNSQIEIQWQLAFVQLKRWQETGWERGGVTRSKGPQSNRGPLQGQSLCTWDACSTNWAKWRPVFPCFYIFAVCCYHFSPVKNFVTMFWNMYVVFISRALYYHCSGKCAGSQMLFHVQTPFLS